MTEWLVHFTRYNPPFHPREVLSKILTEGVLRPGFALRGHPAKSTIYGPFPAVCFSEQPLAMFIQYLAARADWAAMAGYGLLIHKHDLYAAGGLPVIYGLGARELERGDDGYDPSRRLLDPTHISLYEQYRYVAFAPNRKPYPLDWSHEREWRWPSYSGGPLELGHEYRSTSTGEFLARLHAFVEYDVDIPWLQGEIQRALEIDAAGKISENSYYHLWWRPRLAEIFVISLETIGRELQVGRTEFSRFEDLPSEYRASLIVRRKEIPSRPE